MSNQNVDNDTHNMIRKSNMKRQVDRSVVEKLWHGGPMTDDDLKELQYFYSNVVEALEICYLPEYRLVLNDARENLRRVEGYIKSRESRY